MGLPTVLLFDVDGTLVDTGGAGRRSIEAAFADVFADVAEPLSFPFAGMTDRAIIRRGLVERGLEVSARVMEAIVRAYLARLAVEVPASPRYRVLTAVPELLDAVLAQRDFAVGLGTGNVEPGARIKLRRGGIAERFAFGGFGCDHEDRAALLAAGARRGAERLGVPLEHCRVVVIGDTPKDIAAASAIGAECLAVATGAFDVATLGGLGASRIAADLSDPAALAWLLAA
jgi:phosphoglycolate phosphatase